MRRLRHLLPAALALATVGAALAEAPVVDTDALRAAADSLLALTRTGGAGGPWGDPSDATRGALRSRQDRLANELRRISRTALSTPEDRLLYDNLVEVVAGSRAARTCRFELWYAPSMFAGVHLAAANWSRTASVADDASRTRTLQGLRDLPGALSAERAMLERGLDSGYTSSSQVIRVVVRQLRDLVPDDIERSPLYEPVRRDSTAVFREAYAGTLRQRVYPAIRGYADFLESRYLPSARRDGSLVALPNGVGCYRATLRERTSVDADPSALIDESRGEIDRLRRDLAPLVAGLTGATDLSDGIRLLKTDARFTFPSRDSTLAAYRGMTAFAAARIERVMAGVTPESIVVIPYPEFQERAGVPPSYQRAPDDRSRPATFLVNLGRPERMAVGSAVAHEAYPGHHLQRIAASQASSIHPVMRTIGVSAFSEGWGIYSEDLGAEMGLYTTDLDRAGHLVHLLDVAVAYYLDAGAHVRGWTRETLVDSMYVLGGRTRAQAGDYADRHAATPGQLATYYVGYRTVRAARADAERKLGARFDLPRFNREVVRDGTITLASLQAKLEGWVAAQR
jgi:uncharacterized protein (DUF885 family)